MALSIKDLRPWEWDASDSELHDRIREVQHAFWSTYNDVRADLREVHESHEAAVSAARKARDTRR